MKIHAYITFLLKRFFKPNEQTLRQDQLESLSHKWFGMLPFMWKWMVSETKK